MRCCSALKLPAFDGHCSLTTHCAYKLPYAVALSFFASVFSAESFQSQRRVLQLREREFRETLAYTHLSSFLSVLQVALAKEITDTASRDSSSRERFRVVERHSKNHASPMFKSLMICLEIVGTVGYNLIDSFMTLSRYFNCESCFIVAGSCESWKTWSISSWTFSWCSRLLPRQ